MADTLVRDPRFGMPLGGTPRNAYKTPTVYGVPTTFTDNPVQPGELVRAPRETTTVTPDTGTTTTQVGSPLNTLYGVSGDSFLTDDQRRLSRAIQGKFDASTDQRDRELARYGAPRLSSFAEDEALARAIAEAQGLNYRPPVDALGNPVPRGGNSGGGGGGGGPLAPRVPAAANPTNPNANGPAKWAQILSGLSSLAPLLFGKDAYGQFLNRGLLGTIKDKLFGPGASQAISDAQLEQIVSTGALPGGGGMVFNPITGMPMTSYGDGLTTPTGNAIDNYESIYQDGNSSGNFPDFSTGDGGFSDWFGTGPAQDWSNWWTPDSGGDFLDVFGGV